MKCPLCNHETITKAHELFQSNDKDHHGPFPSFTCPQMVTPNEGQTNYPHYVKRWDSGWTSNYYYEEAIVLPFKVTNHYASNGCFSVISEFKDQRISDPKVHKDVPWGFVKVLRLSQNIRLTNPEELLNKIKTYLVFS